jgi:histone H3/H4
MEFSIRSMKLIIRENTEKRVSEDSATALGEFLDNWSGEVDEDATEIAEGKGRKTVRVEDIKQALNNRTSRDVKEHLDL